MGAFLRFSLTQEYTNAIIISQIIPFMEFLYFYVLCVCTEHSKSYHGSFAG